MYISGFLEEPPKPPEVLYNSGGFVQQRRFCTTAEVLYNSGGLVQQRRWERKDRLSCATNYDTLQTHLRSGLCPLSRTARGFASLNNDD